MATLTTSICDKCGASKKETQNIVGRWMRLWTHTDDTAIDFCEKCAEDFRTWLAGDSTDSAAPSTASNADAGKDEPADPANTAATTPSPGGPTPMRSTAPTGSPTDTPDAPAVA